MYKPIKITVEEHTSKSGILEMFNLLDCEKNNKYIPSTVDVYTEAVFRNGRKTMEPIVELIGEAKEILLKQIKRHDDTIDSSKPEPFNAIEFWKDPVFKKIENELKKIFGFRNIDIYPSPDKYDYKKKSFDNEVINCTISYMKRYPIDGLVTNVGFYDATHSITTTILFSLKMLQIMEPDELVAIFLHELGHSIDPSLVDINYTKTNILSKYLTDREEELTVDEKRFIKNGLNRKDGIVILPLIISMGFTEKIEVLFKIITNSLKRFFNKVGKLLSPHYRYTEYKIEDFKKYIQDDKDFNRQNYIEAFADNFARMYGFAIPLSTALQKIESDILEKDSSYLRREKDRQRYILHFIEEALKDQHKTSVHRVRALIKEYENDINDPVTPSNVKKNMKEDINELEKVLDAYLNNFSDFQNRINTMINEELAKVDAKSKVKNESYEYMNESKLSAKDREKNYLTPKEREEVQQRFGDIQCSIFKDGNGMYYATTHRARSKAFPSIETLPIKDVEFISSTS